MLTAAADPLMQSMPRPADKIPENIDYAAQEMLEAPGADRPTMLENIAKALTRRLLKDERGIGAVRVTAFVRVVQDRLDSEHLN